MLVHLSISQALTQTWSLNYYWILRSNASPTTAHGLRQTYCHHWKYIVIPCGKVRPSTICHKTDHAGQTGRHSLPAFNCSWRPATKWITFLFDSLKKYRNRKAVVNWWSCAMISTQQKNELPACTALCFCQSKLDFSVEFASNNSWGQGWKEMTKKYYLYSSIKIKILPIKEAFAFNYLL